MKAITIVAACLLLGACAGQEKIVETKIQTVEVDKPVAVSCVPQQTPEPPLYVDSDAALKAAADAAARYQLLVAGRGQRITRIDQTEPIIQGCR